MRHDLVDVEIKGIVVDVYCGRTTMRHRLASQVVLRSNDVCIFCSLKWSPGLSTIRESSQRPTRRAYTSSGPSRAPAGAAVARKEDDEEDNFPLFKQNAAAAAGLWTASKPELGRGAPEPRAPEPQHRFSMRGGRKPSYQGREPRQDDRHDSRDQQQARHRTQSTQNEGIRPQRDNRFGLRDNLQNSFVRHRIADNDGPRRGDQDGGHGQQNILQGRTVSEAMGSSRGRRFGSANAQQEHNEDSPVRFAKSTGFVDDGTFRIRKHMPMNSHASNARERALEMNMRRRQEAQPKIVHGQQEVRADPNELQDFRPLANTKPPQRRQRQDPEQQRHDPVLDEVKKIAMPVAEEAEGVAPASVRTRSRFSNRFELEEDTEAELPADKAHVLPKGPQYMGSGRRASTDFDFELYEAEQALNGEKRRRKDQKRRVVQEKQKPTLVIPEFMTVQQLAQSMKMKVDDLVKKLEEEGFDGARFDHMLDAETSAMFADIYGFEPVAGAAEMEDLVARPFPEDPTVLLPRPPIVTIMGHVDHGKTTILDWLRKSSVAAGEHGGITQHIGAFSVTMPGSERQITFLDTPGHEAFLDMRRRGANVTDIVVLVVAADDSVKPQTIEAIKHALEARVQLIVAINKVDKHDADIDQVKQDLTRHDIVVEDYGGDYQAIAVSGKTGQGMAELEEAIITLADVLDLRAEREGPAEGQIIESKVTNAGRVATILVRRGVLRVADFIVAGPTWGRVRTLRNDSGQILQAAYPGDPVQVDGWRGSDPTAGLEVLQAENEQHAKDVVHLRHERAELAKSATDIAALNAVKSSEAEARAKVLAWEAENNVNRRKRGHTNEGWIDGQALSGPKPVHFVVKADVAGSVEAIVAAISGIGNHEVQANVIHSGTGPVTESDVRMLATTGEVGYAISFNQPIESAVHNLAYAAGLEVLDQNIIYRVTEAVKDRLSAALPPLVTQRVLGEAEVGKIFDVTVKKEKIKIAGCKVTNGTISRANQVRVIRNGETVYTGTLHSLKNVKKDVTEMRKGTECGMGFQDWENVQEGDQVQCFEEKEEKRTLR